MILVASQRGGAGQLAAHLMNDRDNDHVTVAQMRGFVGDTLREAFDEAHAISRATRCTQFLFSLSVNPPKEAAVDIDALVAAVDRAETALGLEGQPRAIVIHEKQGRRHAHVVWSRIDAAELKAINLPHFKNRLRDLSRELYLDHGWELPEGHRTNGWKNPLNFTLAEWQQAKRLDLDPREIKQVFQAAWRASDNLKSFRNALEERGYFLAQGDRRGFVALDIHGEVYSVARWIGVKTKEVDARLGAPDHLPSVEAVRASTHERLTQRLREHLAEDRQNKRDELAPLAAATKDMVAGHRAERALVDTRLEERRQRETKDRASRFNRGLGAVMEFLTGRTFAIRRTNEAEAYRSYLRDRAVREALFNEQTRERRVLQARVDDMRARHREDHQRLASRIAEVLRHTERAQREQPPPARRRTRTNDLDLNL